MKKIVLAVLAISATLLFTSCGSFWDDLFGKVTGTASVTVNGETSEYSSSIVMNGTNDSVPFCVGMAMNMSIDDLMEIENEEQITYPIFCYRFASANLKSGATLTAENVVTEEDLADIRYTDMISGKFSNNQMVGVAVNDTLFYVMSTGTITLDKVSKSKVTGSFSGSAYVINRNAEPKLSEEQVSISGSFVSRVVPMKAWIKNLQERQ